MVDMRIHTLKSRQTMLEIHLIINLEWRPD
jgi:hypothetical protein